MPKPTRKRPLAPMPKPTLTPTLTSMAMLTLTPTLTPIPMLTPIPTLAPIPMLTLAPTLASMAIAIPMPTPTLTRQLQMYKNHGEIYSDPFFRRPSASNVGFAHITAKAILRHLSKQGSDLVFCSSSINLDAMTSPWALFLTRKSVQNLIYSQMEGDFLDLGHSAPSSWPRSAR